MAEFPGFTIWTDAYLGDTNHLTTIEHGAYFLLLMTMWRAGGTLPNDDKKLAKYAKMTPGQWVRVRDTVMGFFTDENGQITQSRLTREMEFVRQRSERQSRNARSKPLKDKEPPSATAKPLASQTPAPTLTPTPTLREDSSLRSLEPELDLAFEDWNTLAGGSGLPLATSMSKKRKTALRERLKECGGREGWQEALRLIPQSPFLMGDNSTGFTATLDFVLQASSFTKLREGNYAKRGNGPAQKPSSADAFGSLAEFYRAQAIREGEDSGSIDGPVQNVPKLAYHRA